MQAFKEKFRAENTIFHASIGIAALLLSVLGFIVAREHGTLPELTEKILSISVTTQNIRYYEDNRLSAVTLAVYSGDADGRQHRRYVNSSKKLHAAFQDAARLEKEITGGKTITDRINIINKDITARHLHIFRQLNPELPAAEYKVKANEVEQDREYNRSLTMLHDTLYNQISDNIAAVKSATSVKTMVFCLCLLLLLATWVISVGLLNRARKSLASYHRLLEAVVDHMPLAFYAKKRTGNGYAYVRFNRTAEKFFGLSRNDMLQQYTDPATGAGADNALNAAEQQVLDTSGPVTTEHESIRTECGVRLAQTVRIPVYENGEPAMIIGFIRDITEEVEREQERVKQEEQMKLQTMQLQETIRAAEESAAKRTAFLANISHELRMPAQDIRRHTKTALRDLKTLEENVLYNHLSGAGAASKRLLHTLDNLQDMHAIDCDNMDFTFKAESVRDVIDTAASDVAPLLREKNMTLATSFADIPDTIAMDGVRITQAVTNMVANAVMSSPNAARIQLHITLIEEYNRLSISVTDESPGISESGNAAVFKSFSGEDNATDHISGAELGLKVCCHIVRKHNGIVRARNRNDHKAGVVCEMLLPLRHRQVTQEVSYVAG